MSAVTVAVRGPRSSSDSSPKAAPGPSVATLRPLRFAVAVAVDEDEHLAADLALSNQLVAGLAP